MENMKDIVKDTGGILGRYSYTPGEVAQALAVSESTIRAAINSGAIPSVKYGRSVRITAETFEKVAREGWKA